MSHDGTQTQSMQPNMQAGLKILGFDIGVASIGWAFVEGGELKDCGVRIFTKAENPKDGSSLALPRREARGARRRLARRKGRLNTLKGLICKEFRLKLGDYLASAGQLPKAYKIAKCENPKYDKYEKRKDIRKNGNERDKQELTREIEKIDANPYKLRAQALERRLSAEEFARVILHIAKHRGYGNKHAKESSDNDSGKVKKAISENAKVMSEKGYTTAGQYLYGEFYQKVREEGKSPNNTQGTQEFQNVRNKSENYARCLSQSELQKEIRADF